MCVIKCAHLHLSSLNIPFWIVKYYMILVNKWEIYNDRNSTFIFPLCDILLMIYFTQLCCKKIFRIFFLQYVISDNFQKILRIDFISFFFSTGIFKKLWNFSLYCMAIFSIRTDFTSFFWNSCLQKDDMTSSFITSIS